VIWLLRAAAFAAAAAVGAAALLLPFNSPPLPPSLPSQTRNYYVRYDYEGVDKTRAEAMVTFMTSSFAAITGEKLGRGYVVAVADEFEYTDSVDGSVSSNQGIR